MSRPDWIEVGRISRPHGTRGEVRITRDSDNPERFAPGSVFHARPPREGIAAGPRLRQQVQLTVESLRGGEDFPIVSFREVTDRDHAEALRGYVLEVRSSELPELDEDEFYPFDLEGLQVLDPRGSILGRVTEIVESPAHPILVIALESGEERMIPFVLAAVPTVAVAEGYLVIDPCFLADHGNEGGGDQDAGEQGDAHQA